MKLASMLSSVLVGGLVFGSTFSAAQRPPKPPTPPSPPSVHVHVDGVDVMIDQQIEHALKMVAKDPRIPADVRDKVAKRLEKVRKKVRAKAAGGKLDARALAQLGDEIEDEMEEFGEEMEKWGEQFGKEMERKFGKSHKSGNFKFGPMGGSFDVQVDVDDDDDDDVDDMPDIDDDDEDFEDAVRDLGDLDLKPQQREMIKKLRADSDAKVAAAKRELERLSEQLEKQLENPASSEAEIARSIDAVTQQEAAMRKARILAWVNARRVLDDAQRSKVQGAASHTGHKTSPKASGIRGRVKTHFGPLTVYADVNSDSRSVGSLKDGAAVTITCQKTGEAVKGPYGTSKLWNKVGDGYVPDAFVLTGSDRQVAPTCP